MWKNSIRFDLMDVEKGNLPYKVINVFFLLGEKKFISFLPKNVAAAARGESEKNREIKALKDM